MLDQFGARHHAPGVMHQIGEQPVFVAGELDRIAVDRDAAGARVEPHGAAVELAFGVAGGAAQQRAHARQHLLEVEGLGDVVVGAGVEALHLVAPAVARGEHQHRHGAPGAPPGFQHRDAVHLRQADVEDHRVIGLGLAEVMALLAVEGAIDDIAGVGQRGGELAVEVGVVLDDEEAQRLDSPLSGLATDSSPLAASTVACITLPLRRKQSQHVDQLVVVAAKPGAHDLDALAVRAQDLMALASGMAWWLATAARCSALVRQAWCAPAATPARPARARRQSQKDGGQVGGSRHEGVFTARR